LRGRGEISGWVWGRLVVANELIHLPDEPAGVFAVQTKEKAKS